MDPNEALRQLRELVHTCLYSEDEAPDIATDLAQQFEALDEWLSKGGFPPDAWRYGNDVATAMREREAT